MSLKHLTNNSKNYQIEDFESNTTGHLENNNGIEYLDLVNDAFSVRKDTHIEETSSNCSAPENEETCDKIKMEMEDSVSEQFNEKGVIDTEEFTVKTEYDRQRGLSQNINNEKSALVFKKTIKQNRNFLPKQNNYDCYLCEFTANNESNLQEHLDSVHLNKNEGGCAEGKCSSIRKKRVNHIGSVRRKLKIKCNLCDHVTTSRSNLKTHRDSVHLKIRQHQCHICEYCTNHKANLVNHISSIHLNLKKHKCELCDYAATLTRDLKIHVNTAHFNIKQHKCNFCDYAASQKVHLKDHIGSVHLNLKQHKCSLCDYAANHKSYLKKHIDSVHLNLKKHKCSLCDFETNHKTNLKRHIDSIHTNLKHYRCNLCQYASNRKFHLKNHVDAVHSNLKLD